MRGIYLDLAVLRIHTIDIFRTEKHSPLVYRGFLGGVMNARGSQT
jgi:hypothetical protein